eukprot:gnl/TRDRNA2_/TRDRNA2_181098_c0_seq1.p1 gnl/TRDRNA2_/TRDRNA2_181098_c0~~gnl/TRDRNA2_/TRDRNA2_181098_c0_seq1.p1  ORF type:complete len:179 (+),score=54.85 gnl/TRDRNA2_/TRDRNA2_181098_c0_seq1:88-624(+)
MQAEPLPISHKELVERVAVMLAGKDLASMSLKQVRRELEEYFVLASGSLDDRKAEIDELVVAEIERIAANAGPETPEKAMPGASGRAAKRKAETLQHEKGEKRRKSDLGKMLEQVDEQLDSTKKRSKKASKSGQKTSTQAQGGRVLAQLTAAASVSDPSLKEKLAGLPGNVCLDMLGF